MEATWAGSIPPTQALINSVASSGYNTIRIPCAWNHNADPTTYQINATYMTKVKQVVDWSRAAGLYVIINDHDDDFWLEPQLTGTYNSTLNAKMNSYWTQIATAFASYDSHLLFAATNEPNCNSDTAAKLSELTAYYQTFINAVRTLGGNNSSRWLVIQGPTTDVELTNTYMNTLPSDSTPGRLMVEVHYYSPFQFTLLGADATWGNMFYFWGNGYHSTTLPSRNATWGEEAYMDSEFQKMTDKFVSKGIPVIIGEYGAYKRGTLTGADYKLNYASTTYFDQKVVKSANNHGLYPIYWSTPKYVFDWTTGAVLDQPTIDATVARGALPPPIDVWSGPGTDYMTAVNWGGNLPSNGLDEAQFNGFVGGNLVLGNTSTTQELGNTSTGGITIHLTGAQTGSVSLDYTGTLNNSYIRLSGNAGVPAVLVDSGAGALTFGNGTGSGNTAFKIVLGNGGSPQTVVFTNNSSNPVTFNSDVTFANGGGSNKTLQFTGSGNFVFNNVIINDNGGRSVSQIGTGTLTLAGSNSYTGATTINAGTLSTNLLANGGSNSGIGLSSNAAANLVINGGILRYTGAATSTDRNFTLGDSDATIDASGSGALSMSGAATYVTANAARTLTLTGTNTAANTYGSVLANNGSGALSLTKSGAGTWALSGANTYTGATTISAGTLFVDGSIATSIVTVASNATLSGTGTTGNVIEQSGGAVAPGHGGIGTLATANTTLNGILAIEIASAVSADRLNVSGSLTLAGPLLVTAPAGLSAGTTVTIVNKTGSGAVNGTFSNQPQDSQFAASGNNFIISYTGGDGDDVTLTVATAQQAWKWTYFGSNWKNAALAGDTADPDNDGVSNLLEYATGRNPTIAQQGQAATMGTTTDGTSLTLKFQRIADPSLTYEVLASNDLSIWNVIWSSTGAQNTAGAVEVSDSELKSAHAKRFLKLRVSKSALGS